MKDIDGEVEKSDPNRIAAWVEGKKMCKRSAREWSQIKYLWHE